MLPEVILLNIASFLKPSERLGISKEIDNTTILDAKFIIRSSVRRWRKEYNEGGWFYSDAKSLKKFTPLCVRKLIVGDDSFDERVDNMSGIERYDMHRLARRLLKKS